MTNQDWFSRTCLHRMVTSKHIMGFWTLHLLHEIRYSTVASKSNLYSTVPAFTWVKCAARPLIHSKRKFVAHSCLTFGCTGAHGSFFTFQGFRELEMVSSGLTDVTDHCCSSFVGESHCWALAVLVRSQFYPLFVLHQTQTITTLERVTDNESVKSMFACSILYVPMGSSIRSPMTKCSAHSFHIFYYVVCLFLKSILPQSKYNSFANAC